MEKEVTRLGFTILGDHPMPEYRGRGIWLVHDETGCEIFHVLTEDKENLFAFTFNTPPKDSKGTAHIVEHAVLSGSKNYPLKDPFLTLLKGSMNTFLNAMTYPDKTTYPAASILEKDYFNLMAVYGDAVFFPLLRKEVFLQEGHRLEFGGEEVLSVNGVVYNEMTGSYASHESIAAEYSYRTLFPDSPYRFDSGGEPDSIVTLSYGQFKKFHETYYHPSNCRIFLYGDIDTVKQCSFLSDRFLSHFMGKKERPAINSPEKWKEPRSFTFTSPLGQEEDPAGKTTLTINWLTLPVSDSVDLLSLEVLAESLLGNAGSPLHKAILDSRLGEDISPLSGLEADLAQAVFTVGLRGTDPEKMEEFRVVVFNTLQELAEKGFQEEVLSGSLKRVEFRYREMKGGVPFGLRLLGKILKGWTQGQNPGDAVAFEKPFSIVKGRVKTDPGYLKEMITGLLLKNPHYSKVIVRPDTAHQEKEEEKIGAFIKEKEKTLTADIRREILSDMKSLRTFQDEEDSEEVVSSIPHLALEDLPGEVENIPFTKTDFSGVQGYNHDLFTNGVVYVDLALDTKPVPEELVPFLPLYSKIVCNAGIPGISYDEMARKLALHSGGIFSFLEASNRIDKPEEEEEYLFFRVKTLESDLSDGFSLFRDLILSADFSDKDRIADQVREYRNDLKSSILNMGNSYAGLRAASRLSTVLALEEKWRGITQFLFVNDLCESLEERLEGLVDSLVKIRGYLNCRDNLSVSICSDKKMFREAETLIEGFISYLSRKNPTGKREKGYPENIKGETLLIPGNIGYAATALPGTRLANPGYSGEQLLAHVLKTDYLWNRIRMKGGAYGVSASANGAEGIFLFSSYRDPQVAGSLPVFAESVKELQRELSKAELEKAIIGVVGKESHPMAPGEKSLVNFRRRLYGITDELRQAKRDSLLSCSPRDLSKAAEFLSGSFDQAVSSVLTGSDSLAGLSRISGDFIKNSLPIPV